MNGKLPLHWKIVVWRARWHLFSWAVDCNLHHRADHTRQHEQVFLDDELAPAVETDLKHCTHCGRTWK